MEFACPAVSAGVQSYRLAGWPLRWGLTWIELAFPVHRHGQVEQCAGLIVGLSSILQAGHLYWALAAPHEGALEPAVSEQWHEGSAPVCSFLSLLCLLRIYPSEGHFLEFLHHLSHSCEGQTFRLHFFGSQTTRPHVQRFRGGTEWMSASPIVPFLLQTLRISPLPDPESLPWPAKPSPTWPLTPLWCQPVPYTPNTASTHTSRDLRTSGRFKKLVDIQ